MRTARPGLVAEDTGSCLILEACLYSATAVINVMSEYTRSSHRARTSGTVVSTRSHWPVLVFCS